MVAGVRLGLGLAAGLCVALAHAQNPKLRIQGDYAFPPYSYLREGKPVGIDVDIVQELGRRSGVQFDIGLVPFKRVVESVRAGSVEAGMALLHNAEREGFALFTGVLHNSTYSLFVLKDRPMRFDGSLDSLQGQRIGKVRGFFVSEAFDAEVAVGRVQLEETAGSEQGLQMLRAGRVDAISGQTVVTRYLAQQAGMVEALRVLPFPLVPDKPAFLVLSRAAAIADREALGERLRLMLEQMHRDGSIARIEARHLQ